ncbi:hypothetical protein GE061_012475 [Apolygus lucorum]|uniref:Uncharacterized protein n=1 Tax=Apolygus lucorum TaxID=248454 RepID=A0A8S9XUN9_APOLU|nr:hypothetical protein GE061_012475 [Apolygus lucorum]
MVIASYELWTMDQQSCFWYLSDNVRGGRFIMSEWTESLLSLEKLDRSSPELWPEAIPGVTEYAARNSLTNIAKNVADQIRVLDAEDTKLLNYYRTLNKDNLLQELRKLHDLAYKLGLEESKEMTRGRFLNILPSGRRKYCRFQVPS